MLYVGLLNVERCVVCSLPSRCGLHFVKGGGLLAGMEMYFPSFRITAAMASDLSKIDQAKGFLEGLDLSVEWVQQEEVRVLAVEAHASTHIEGSQLTLDEAEQVLAGLSPEHSSPDDVRELINWRQAFDFVKQQASLPVKAEMILEIHRLLVDGVRGGSAGPGEYRNRQNYIVDQATDQVVYTPPPPGEVEGLMEQFVRWLQAPSKLHPVIISGIAQFQLVHIHPFRDGNGRASRLLSTLCLYRAGYDFRRMFTLSEYYDRDRAAFYRAIQGVRDSGMDLTGWLEYFVRGLAVQLFEVKRRSEDGLRADAMARAHGLNQRQRQILFLLLVQGTAGIQQVERRAGSANRRTLQRDLACLVELGLVTTSGATSSLRYRLV